MKESKIFQGKISIFYFVYSQYRVVYDKKQIRLI